MALTAEGLETRSYDEVLAQLENDERANVHPDIDTRDDEVLGAFNNILSLTGATFEQLTQAVLDSLDPDLAEGIWLEKLAFEKGVTRLFATKSSTAFQDFTGVNGTNVPVGTIIQSTITADQYQVVNLVAIDATSCRSATYTISSLLNNTAYDLSVNSFPYSYLSDANATVDEILNGLKALIDADLTKTWTATVDLVEETITVDTADSSTINVSSTTYLSSTSVSTYGTIEALVSGPKIGITNTVTVVVSTVGGLTSTYNTADMAVGREEETDLELRERMYAATNIKSVAVVPAITSRVEAVSGVTNAVLTENTTGDIDGEGRPPHSYEVVVEGGSDEDLAQELWVTKPAGIATHGSTSVNLFDSQGVEQTVKFTRPSAINMAFRVTYTVYSEETLPADADDLIVAIMVSETMALPIGKDVIPQRYFGPLYEGVEGIATLVVEQQELVNPGDAPLGGSWVTTNFPIASTNFASTTSADVSVVAA